MLAFFFRQSGGLVISLLKVIRIVVWVSGDVVVSGFTFPFLRRSPEGSPGTSKPLEDLSLFCLPPLSRRRTNFGRHRRSVQARVSLRDVTQDKAARKQRPQASSAASGLCVRSETVEERTSFRWCVGT